MEYITIGNVKIEKTASLAPMASVADKAMRTMCKKYGAALLTGEIKSTIMVELADELSQTLRLFRGRLLEEEIKHQYYENLLNKVDTAVVVTDRSGRVEWMNRAAVGLVGQESRLPQEWLTTSWNET